MNSVFLSEILKQQKYSTTRRCTPGACEAARHPGKFQAEKVDNLGFAQRSEGLNGHEAGFALLGFLNGNQDGGPSTTTASFTGLVRTQVGIVDFDQVGESIATVTLAHGDPQAA